MLYRSGDSGRGRIPDNWKTSAQAGAVAQQRGQVTLQYLAATLNESGRTTEAVRELETGVRRSAPVTTTRERPSAIFLRKPPR